MDAYDVAVVGGGPVGMWLAAELHRGGVRPVVLERRAERLPYSKALTIYPRTVEQFAMRGLVDRWLAEGTPVPSSHFALMKNRLDFSFLPTRYPFTLFLPQRRTEELLEEHLAELGVPYLRRHAVTGLRQDQAGVDLDVDSPGGPAVVRAAYAVGCDGATSVVRAAAGIDFEGSPDTWRTILGDIELTDPPQTPALTLNQPGGSLYMVAIGGGRYRLAVIDHATLYDPLDKPATFGELRASALRLAGTDFGMLDTPDAWLSRVGNAARQAARYRAGRVLLAGDAAHIHYPAGGQGLNLGLQDATNLAWKLAAEIRGWAPPGLLDSYHGERYPVGLDVIDDSLAQCGLFANPTREGVALRDWFNTVLAGHPTLCRELAVRLSGLGIGYPAPGQALLAGQRAPDLDLYGTPDTIFASLQPAKFVLLNLGSVAAVSTVQPGFADRLDTVTAELAGDTGEWAGIRAMLIRPDGYIAWATPADDAPPLARWLGPALCEPLEAPGRGWKQRRSHGYDGRVDGYYKYKSARFTEICVTVELVRLRGTEEEGRPMIAPGSPTVRRRRLAAELRGIREDRGKSGDAVAAALKWSPSKISRYERARTGLRPREVERLLDYYQITGSHRALLLGLAEDAAQKGWWEEFADSLSEDYQQFIGLEHEAATMSIWHVDVVAGLLQTEEYARHIISSYSRVEPIPPGLIGRLVRVRMRRQEVLNRDGLQLSMVLDESVLRRRIGADLVMYEQLQRLAREAERPNLTLQILPLSAQHVVFGESFVVFGFGADSDAMLQDVVVTEQLKNSFTLEGERETYLHRIAFQMVADASLDPVASRELILETAESHWSGARRPVHV